MRIRVFGWVLALALAAGPVPASVAGARSDADGGGLWTRVLSKAALAGSPDVPVADGFFEVYALDENALAETLARVPLELTERAKRGGEELAIPMPDGALARFEVWESPVMEPGLAAQFPDIRTFVGQGLDDRTATARLDWTHMGFHAQVISADRTVYVDPYRAGDTSTYISYDKRGYLLRDETFECFVPNADEPGLEKGRREPSEVVNGSTFRTYRLACAATGEYTAFHDARGSGTALNDAMAAITTSVNRVNGVYEREFAVRMLLVANNASIVYTSASQDPYSNTNGSAMLGQNQSTLDSVIGSANYDIGHVFSTGGGGVAYLRAVCNSSIKAGGVTGSSSPIGDAFDIDYVAHEMGHQFGGNHTFNDCGSQRNASTAYEPGSGTTIMAYAGICGSTNVALNSDDVFHTISHDEVVAFITSGGGANCDVASSSGNTPPSVNAGADYTIPQNTPFTLTASGSDANGDSLTYCWEQFDLGSVGSSTQPLFRSRRPAASPSRTFPQMSDILSGAATPWEKLPTVNRTMTFRCTARDNRAGGGGINVDTMVVTVSGSQFAVTSPNTAVTWGAGSQQTVTWTVGGGSVASQVRILLSTDGGATFPTVLASNAANDGSETVTLPATQSTQCRIKIEAVGNIFFDVSNVNFTIGQGGGGGTLAAPSNLTATAVSSSQVNLAWVDNSSNETEFRIERRVGSRGSWQQIATVGAGVVTYGDTTVSRNTTYYYRTRAANSSATSAYSNLAQVRTPRR